MDLSDSKDESERKIRIYTRIWIQVLKNVFRLEGRF